MQTKTPLEKIRELYFDKLEENAVEFISYEDIGYGYSENRVKDEFADVSVEEMVDYIWGDSWQGEWAKINVKGI